MFEMRQEKSVRRGLRGVMRAMVVGMAVLFWGGGELAMGIGAKGLPFEMREVKQGRVVVLYGEEFNGEANEIEAWVAAINARDVKMRDEAKKVAKDLEPIAQRIDGMIGGSYAEQFVKSNAGAFMGQLIGSGGVLGLAQGDVVIGLIDREKLFGFVKQGGEVDGITIDKQTGVGRVELIFKAGKGMNGELYENVVDWTLPVDGGAAGLKERLDSIETILLGRSGGVLSGDELKGVAIHEIAEIAILRRMGKQDRFTRWFTDGAANVITEKVLEGM